MLSRAGVGVCVPGRHVCGGGCHEQKYKAVSHLRSSQRGGAREPRTPHTHAGGTHTPLCQLSVFHVGTPPSPVCDATSEIILYNIAKGAGRDGRVGTSEQRWLDCPYPSRSLTLSLTRTPSPRRILVRARAALLKQALVPGEEEEVIPCRRGRRRGRWGVGSPLSGARRGLDVRCQMRARGARSSSHLQAARGHDCLAEGGARAGAC